MARFVLCTGKCCLKGFVGGCWIWVRVRWFFGEGLKGNKTGAVGRVMCSRDNRGGFTRAALSSFTRASAAFLSFALG